jgi:hypothetical protein
MQSFAAQDRAARAALKAARRAAKAKPPQPRTHVDCACVIHGAAYDWIYVERLYNMVSRNMHVPIRMHVYTEHDRSVPPHMIKHCLVEWPGISGPKRSWWYKMQLFDPDHFAGDLLYFDLDTVICGDISWCVENSARDFWTLRDFRYLQKASYQGINSSLMWFNTQEYGWVWDAFVAAGVNQVSKQYPGDQDYLFATITPPQRRLYEDRRVASYRWQLREGGWDFIHRRFLRPGIETVIPPDVSVINFHGRPKPHQIQDPIIAQHWQ